MGQWVVDANYIQMEQQPFVMVRPNGQIDACNHAFAELVGYTEEELKSMRWDFGLTHPEWCQEENKKFEELVRTGHPCLFVKEYLHKDGSRKPVELLVHVIRDRRGEVQYFYAFITDITRNKLKEAHPKIDRGQFSLMGDWPGFVYRCVNDKNWTMKSIRGDFQTLSGYSIEDVIDNKTIAWGKIVHPNDHERTWDVAQVGINESRPFQQEYRIITKDGVVKWVLEQCLGIVNNKGEEFFEGFITDITERKRAEEQIQSLLINCEESLKEVYHLNNKIVSILQEFNSSQGANSEKAQKCIQTLFCIQTMLCRLIDSVGIDFAGFDRLAQEVEFIFDGKDYFYPK